MTRWRSCCERRVAVSEKSSERQEAGIGKDRVSGDCGNERMSGQGRREDRVRLEITH